MLSIGKLGSGQEMYYLEKVAEGVEDYYSGEGEEPGQWLGDAAAELGLCGEVEPDQLIAMLTGNDPASGEPLGLRAVAGRGPVPGFDLTFSVPKSVSLIWALGGTEVAAKVKAAHERSVKAALHYMQREACWTRRGAGGAEFLQGNGYLAAGYLHRSSRNGDFQLHTHVLIANATKGPDGRWTRLYHPAIYEHAKTAGYLFEAHLRHELTRELGVAWQPVRNGIAEIEGFADEWLRAFSTRRAEILEAAGADASARARQVATLTTRAGKEKGVGLGTLRERWAGRATEIGIEREDIAATFGRAEPERAQLTVEQLDREVTAHAAHFDRRGAVQAVANLLPNGAPAEDIEAVADAFLASETVLAVAETSKATRYTTQRIWELERETLERAERMVGEPRGEAGELIAARVIASRPTLKDDQREMVRRLLAGREGIVVVIGEAGTGKSFATVACAEGWAQARYRLQAVAPTWRAANVLRGEGLEAASIASLLGELERGDNTLNARAILLVDEAGMIGTQDLHRLIAHADEGGAKVVLIGDPEQLGAIEAGGLFAALAERTEPVHLDEVIRHNHTLDRDAAKHIREGEGREALSLYREAERVVVAPDAAERRAAMVADWWSSYREGEDALMVAKRNVEVERLNSIAREVLRTEGRLGTEEIEVGGAPFAAGDLLITRVNDRAAEVFNRERWRVAEVDAEKGRIVLQGLDKPGRVEVGPDYLERTALNGEAPALQHAYAVTTYCAQGTTVDRMFVMADPSMDKQELYVAASRSREDTRLYATPEIHSDRLEIGPAGPGRDAIAHLAEAAERDRAQTAAHEVALRDKLSKLPTEQLWERGIDVRFSAGEEGEHEDTYRHQIRTVAECQERYEQAAAERERAEGLPWRRRRQGLPEAREREERFEAQLIEETAKLEGMRLPGTALRQERQVAEQLLAERSVRQLTALALDPPPYITRELGERPAGGWDARTWDEAVHEIEGYRQSHGIEDRRNVLGLKPENDRLERSRWESALRRLEGAQRSLGLKPQLARTRELTRSVERGFGIDL
jgi:conjugative relaxase-like TrwC/TraI family protein